MVSVLVPPVSLMMAMRLVPVSSDIAKGWMCVHAAWPLARKATPSISRVDGTGSNRSMRRRSGVRLAADACRSSDSVHSRAGLSTAISARPSHG